ncbi:hypothetical protein TEA_022577 [Camellia sinensis var. sinensis]|uniref:Calmodulin-binding domain-containing protein n=1 Tax=Camellia sinensis var. sinensis TaxID=542762 RepID=A0A4S4EIH2_CAMSN|nr:hypothetical protein TEA_022577 [Camellia sinensis var. sinensis]
MAEEVIDIPATPEPEEIVLEGDFSKTNSAEEMIDITATPEPEEIVLEGDHSTSNSAEKMIDISGTPEPEGIMLEGDQHSRHSTGNLIISKREVKVLPRYLTGSMGSCHDYCKYGIEHNLEKKARHPSLKTIKAKAGERRYQPEIIILEVKNKKPLISSKPLADSKSQTTHDKHQVIEKEAPVLAKKIAVLAKKVPVSSKPFFSPGDRIDVSAKHVNDLRPKPVQTKSSPFSSPGRLSTRRYSEILPWNGGLQASLVRGLSSRRHSDTGITKEMRTLKLRKKNNLLPPAVFPPPPRPLIKRELTAKSGQRKELKQVYRLKSQNGVRRAEPKQPIAEKVPEKMIYVVTTKPVNLTVGVTKNGNKKLEQHRHGMPTSQSLPSTESKKLRHTQNGIHSNQSSSLSLLSSEKKTLKHTTRNGIHINQSSSLSSLSSEKKTLRHTKNGNRNAPSSASALSLLSLSGSMKNDKKDPISEGSGTKTENRMASHTKRPRRVVRVSSEIKVCTPMKLNFTRGKVIEVQPRNHIPRILRFKQRRVLGENHSGKADIKQINFGKIVGTADLNGSETKSTNFILRHQSVEGKKDAQSLLNNVIEETASKLVETRKSKVKALMVEVQPRNHIPRILRFKQRRALGENHSGKADIKQRSFRKIVGTADLNGSETKSTNVILRHQSVEGKKDAQSLLNNVIEETASKLVETRKSKVKALMVEVQPRNHIPRILRFKQRRALGENHSGKADIKQRSFRKIVGTADLNGSETKSTNVILRHQSVEGKKDAQSLLNNVIEETASKLVETRKSKVKALMVEWQG